MRFNEAIERIVAGLEKKNRLLNPMERRVVAHHEMGHTLVASALRGADPVHKVSIIPRGVGALGSTIQRPTEDRFLMTQEELENKMAVLLGGRAAEALVFKRISTGASDDLEKATHIARNMATRYGMVSDLGQRTYDNQQSSFLGQAAAGPREYSEASAAAIDRAVQEMVEGAFQRATAVLKQNQGLLEEAAQLLLSKETLGEQELAPLLQRLRRAASTEA